MSVQETKADDCGQLGPQTIAIRTCRGDCGRSATLP